MIPNSVAALVSFLLLLAPGILWQLLQGRHTPSVKETALIEASRVVLASLAATAASALGLIWVWIPLYKRAATAGEDAFATLAETIPYLGAVVATSLVACVLVYAFAWALWRGSKRPITAGRVWHRVFVVHRPPGSPAPALLVELLDGTVWRGILNDFDCDPEDNSRSLALASPLSRKRPGAERFEDKGDQGRTVILPESQIRSIQVIYVREGSR